MIFFVTGKLICVDHGLYVGVPDALRASTSTVPEYPIDIVAVPPDSEAVPSDAPVSWRVAITRDPVVRLEIVRTSGASPSP